LTNFGNHFNSTQPITADPRGSESVLIHLGREDFDLMIDLSYELVDALENNNLGMFDGNEIGGGDTVFFMYGPDAELLFQYVAPVFRRNEFCKGAKAVMRWGSAPDAPKREVIL
jgi:hypothetical protein